jgi:hypothetical protein
MYTRVWILALFVSDWNLLTIHWYTMLGTPRVTSVSGIRHHELEVAYTEPVSTSPDHHERYLSPITTSLFRSTKCSPWSPPKYGEKHAKGYDDGLEMRDVSNTHSKYIVRALI